MPKRTTRLDHEIRKEFCDKVWPCIGSGKRFGTQAEAAKDIAISPQRLNSYLKAKATLGHQVLALISERWDVQFVVAGATLSRSQLQRRRATTVQVSAIQLDLFDQPETISSRNKNVIMKIERKGEHALGFYFEVLLAK